MAIRNKEEQTNDPQLARLQRKRDQAWESAGLARRDGDLADEDRWTKEARSYEALIREYMA